MAAEPVLSNNNDPRRSAKPIRLLEQLLGTLTITSPSDGGRGGDSIVS